MAINKTSINTAVIVDDILTGRTLQAATLLCEQAGFEIIDKLFIRYRISKITQYQMLNHLRLGIL